MTFEAVVYDLARTIRRVEQERDQAREQIDALNVKLVEVEALYQTLGIVRRAA